MHSLKIWAEAKETKPVNPGQCQNLKFHTEIPEIFLPIYLFSQVKWHRPAFFIMLNVTLLILKFYLDILQYNLAFTENWSQIIYN